MNIGRVTLHAAASLGGPMLSETHWRRFSVAANGAAGQAVGFADYRREADFIRAEGNYLARVQIDGGKTGERFSIKAGDKATQEVVIGQ